MYRASNPTVNAMRAESPSYTPGATTTLPGVMIITLSFSAAWFPAIDILKCLLFLLIRMKYLERFETLIMYGFGMYYLSTSWQDPCSDFIYIDLHSCDKSSTLRDLPFVTYDLMTKSKLIRAVLYAE